jgi:ribosomal protein S27AE
VTKQPVKTCVMCGRTEFEVVGEWFRGRADDHTIVDLCERDAPNFEPAASYNPIAAEKIVLAGCPQCGHQRFVIDTGGDVYRCAKCGHFPLD